MALVVKIGKPIELMQHDEDLSMWKTIKEYFEEIFMTGEEYQRLCEEQDAWVEQKNAEQLEEWRKEQALRKRDSNPKTDFDDDVPF